MKSKKRRRKRRMMMMTAVWSGCFDHRRRWWWENCMRAGEIHLKMERYILFLPSKAAVQSVWSLVAEVSRKWICLPSRSSHICLPSRQFLWSFVETHPLLCRRSSCLMEFSSNRHQFDGKTAKFIVPIKNQNICSTTSSTRKKSRRRIRKRGRRWQHWLYYLRPKSIDLCSFHRQTNHPSQTSSSTTNPWSHVSLPSSSHCSPYICSSFTLSFSSTSKNSFATFRNRSTDHSFARSSARLPQIKSGQADRQTVWVLFSLWLWYSLRRKIVSPSVDRLLWVDVSRLNESYFSPIRTPINRSIYGEQQQQQKH